MARPKKTSQARELDAFIGGKVALLRRERGWVLRDLADALGISATHLKAMESGRYGFSADVLFRTASIFGRPVGALLPEQASPPGTDVLTSRWEALFQALSQRDRVVLLELGRKLAGWSETFNVQLTRRPAPESGRLVSLEGVDGVLLAELARQVEERLVEQGKRATRCWYDFRSVLWTHIFERSTDRSAAPHRAFERTLLFASERLHRQEKRIRDQLTHGATVLTPFFTLAPRVYQETEGLTDRTLVDAIEALLLKPDLVVVLLSSPLRAAGRAVQRLPAGGEFYSPYSRPDELSRAESLYEGVAGEFKGRGFEVFVRHVDDDNAIDAVAAEVCRILAGSPPSDAPTSAAS